MRARAQASAASDTAGIIRRLYLPTVHSYGGSLERIRDSFLWLLFIMDRIHYVLRDLLWIGFIMFERFIMDRILDV